jgi:Aspartyl/Asparaginyl beta-hydroxylase
MNNGAFVFENNILTDDEILEAKELALKMVDKKSSVLGGSKYADYRWFQVNLDQDWSISQKILSNLGVEKAELLVFYYLEPGASIHPHRDLSGAGLNNRLRFHVPVVTNPDVDFRVSSERISMAPGDLWCLDTSYKHAVTNGGTETRVHIVVECYITPEIRSRVPNNLATKLHSAAFVMIMASLFARSVIVNTFKDRAYLRDQFSMIAKFIGWRFLRTRPPE